MGCESHLRRMTHRIAGGEIICLLHFLTKIIIMSIKLFKTADVI